MTSRVFLTSFFTTCFNELLSFQGGEGENNDLAKAHPDPFLRSIALWTVKDYSGSLETLVQSNVGEMVRHLQSLRIKTQTLTQFKRL
jgi:hypothetical protein